MMHCSTCDAKIGCICYTTLLDAVTDVEEGCLCEECCIAEALCDVSIEEMLEVINNNNKVTAIVELAVTLTTESNIDYKSVTLRELIQKVIANKQGDVLRNAVIDVLTPQEKLELYDVCYDEADACGNFCEKQV
jgi:hypothetical protein